MDELPDEETLRARLAAFTAAVSMTFEQACAAAEEAARKFRIAYEQADGRRG